MYWTTAFIDDKYFIAHPLDLDKFIKLQEQIKKEKNKLLLPQNLHSQLTPEDENSSMKSYNMQKRPQSSISRDCKT